MPESDTKRRILDAAEQLFAQQGFDGSSLRQIVSGASVNLAAINYHFGSKHGLLQAVLARRLEPLNRERLERLAAHEVSARDGRLRLESVLHALFAPALRLAQDPDRGGPVFLQLVGRVMTDPNEQLQSVLEQQFKELAARFTAAFHRALPKVKMEELFWRIHFMIGSMTYTLLDTHRLKFISGGLCDPNDSDALLRRLVSFVAAGMRASTRIAPARSAARQGKRR